MTSSLLPASRRARVVHPDARAAELRAEAAKRSIAAEERGWREPNAWTIKMVREDGSFAFHNANTYEEACASRAASFREDPTFLFGWVRMSAWRSRAQSVSKDRATYAQRAERAEDGG